jgi:hypothetical protein
VSPRTIGNSGSIKTLPNPSLPNIPSSPTRPQPQLRPLKTFYPENIDKLVNLLYSDLQNDGGDTFLMSSGIFYFHVSKNSLILLIDIQSVYLQFCYYVSLEFIIERYFSSEYNI